MANETTENELNQTGEPGTEYFMETLPGQDRYVAPLVVSASVWGGF